MGDSLGVWVPSPWRYSSLGLEISSGTNTAPRFGIWALFGIKLLKSPGWNLAIERLIARSQPLSYSEGTGNTGLGPLLGMSDKSH